MSTKNDVGHRPTSRYVQISSDSSQLPFRTHVSVSDHETKLTANSGIALSSSRNAVSISGRWNALRSHARQQSRLFVLQGREL